MPNIPYNPPESARVGPPSARASGVEFGSEIPSSVTNVSGAVYDDFGSTGVVGRALEGLGANITSFGENIGAYLGKQQAKKDEEAVATQMAKTSFQPIYNDTILNHPDPSGKGLVQSEQEKHAQFVEDQTKAFAATGASPAAQRAYKLKLLEEQKGYLDNSAVAASKMASDNAVLELDRGIATQLNDIIEHGATPVKEWEKRVTTAEAAIDKSPSVPANMKAQRKLEVRNNFAVARFNKLMHDAKTPEEFQALTKELHNDYWKKQFDTPDYQKADTALAQSASDLANLSIDSKNDPFINGIRSDPTTYDENKKKGLDNIENDPSMTPGQKQIAKDKFTSDAAYVKFVTEAEKAVVSGTDYAIVKTKKEALADITKLQKELDRNPQWAKDLTREQFTNLKTSLIERKNAIDQSWNTAQKQLNAAHDAAITHANAQAGAHMGSLLERLNAGKSVPASDVRLLGQYIEEMKGRGNLTPEHAAQFDTVMSKLIAADKADAAGKTHDALEVLKRQTQYGGADEFPVAPEGTHAVFTPTGRHSPGHVDAQGHRVYQSGSGATLIKSDKGHAIVVANIHDATSVQGMTGRSYTILEGMSAGARGHGVVRLVVVAGRGGGHKSHGDGTEWDIVGYQADGSVWTAAQRAAVAKDAQATGADRFGLYEGGSHRNLLHVGYSHGGYAAAVWGAGGLTSGEASRNFSDPASRAFVGGFHGGGGGGGAALTPDASGWHPRYAQVIGFMESSNRADAYSIDIGPSHALGRYGILRENVGPWAQEAGLGNVTPEQFLGNKEIQDKIFQFKFSQYVKKYGPERAAAAWFAGEGGMNNPNASDTFATTVSGYQTKFRELMGGGDTGGDPAGGGGDTGGGGGKSAADLLSVPVSQSAPQTADQFHQTEFFTKRQSNLDTELKTDPMSTVAGDLKVPIVPISLDNAKWWEERAKLYDQGNAIHQFTAEQQKPFTQDDVTTLTGLLASNDPNKMNQVWARIATWSEPMQKAAYDQLGKAGSPFGATAGRVYASGKPDLANEAVRGNATLASLDTNHVEAAWAKDAKTWFEGNMSEVTRAVIDPSHSAGLKNVADAIYAARYGTGKALNETAYQGIMEQLYGGKFDTVNGTSVAVPEGTSGPAFEAALPALDLTAISVTKTPPIGQDHVTGGLAPIGPVAQAHAHPIRITDGVYAFMDDDGGIFHTIGKDGVGTIYKAYITADTINEAAARAKQEGITQSQSLIKKSFETGGMGAPTTIDPYGQFGLTPPSAEAPATRAITPAAPAAPATPAPLTTSQEISVQHMADDFIDILKRNTKGDDAYLKTAREAYVKNAREGLLKGNAR